MHCGSGRAAWTATPGTPKACRAILADVGADLIFLGNYPSKEAVFEVVGDPAYAAAAEVRTAAVRKSVTTILRVH